MNRSSALLPSLLCTLSALAGAQSSLLPPPPHDDCTTPQAIAGSGPFAFDNTQATTGVQGQAEVLCNFGGSTPIESDLWYVWTAPSTGTFAIETCSGTLLDTKVAVYAGSGCPGASALGCNDDACAMQSEVNFVAVGGSVYTIQLGSRVGGGTGSGSWTITLRGVPPAEDDIDCVTPPALTPPIGSWPMPTASATKSAQTFNTCYASGLDTDVWYTWTPDTSGVYTFDLCPSASAAPAFLPGVNVYDGTLPQCPGALIGCGNDCATGSVSKFCMNATANQTYWVQVGKASGSQGLLSVTLSIYAGCTSVAGTQMCEPGIAGVGACPCGNPPASSGKGCDNSSGTGGGSLGGTGFPSLSADSIVFTTGGQRPTGTSVVMQGPTPIPAGVTFGQGVRCVGGALKRLYVKAAVGGSITAPSGPDPSVSVRSATLGDLIPPGANRYYFVYYRDPIVLGGCPLASTYNATAALALTWLP